MSQPEELAKIIVYHHEFRTALFLSSLTLSTFLFTMKSFIIQIMKKDVYDTKKHQNNVNDLNRNGIKTEYYSSLRNLSNLITSAIALGILNAFFQFTLGYFDTEFYSWICILTSLLTWILVLIVLTLVSINMSTMISYAEEEAEIANNCSED